jgi:tetratricopeptide (TPR) repeat protein
MKKPRPLGRGFSVCADFNRTLTQGTDAIKVAVMKASGAPSLKPALKPALAAALGATLAIGTASLVPSAAAFAQSGQNSPRASVSIPLKPPVDESAAARRVLDELFDRLAKAQEVEEGAGIAGAIQRVWLRSGSDTADLLMARARSMVNKKDAAVALEILDRLVALEPEWSEAWRLRANARFLSADKAGAVEDLARTLTIEPRHFIALADLGSVLYASGFNKRALEVLRRALEVHPRQPDAQALADQLSLSVDGRGI